MNLRDRCKEFLSTLKRNAMLRQNDPVDDLVAFVVTETGRTADTRLETSLPLVLYFKDDADREGFIELVQEAKPNMTWRKMP